MLPKKYRLRKNQDFQKVFHKGKLFNGKYIFLRTLKRENFLGTRIGFTVSKKIHCKAKRNLLKRKLREICRQELKLLNKNLDLVVIIKKNALNASFLELKKDVLHLLNMVNLSKN